MLAEESGALHDLGTHQDRRDHHRETVGGRLLRGQLQEAELQHRARTGEEVEARSRDLRAALHVDQAEVLPEFEVILRVLDLRDLADRLQQDEVLLATGRGLRGDDVVDRAMRGDHLLVGAGFAGVRGLDPLGQFLALGEQRLLLLGGCLADQLSEVFLLGPQLVGLHDGGAAFGVGVEQHVDQRRVLPARALGSPDNIRMLTQNLQVDHV